VRAVDEPVGLRVGAGEVEVQGVAALGQREQDPVERRVALARGVLVGDGRPLPVGDRGELGAHPLLGVVEDPPHDGLHRAGAVAVHQLVQPLLGHVVRADLGPQVEADERGQAAAPQPDVLDVAAQHAAFDDLDRRRGQRLPEDVRGLHRPAAR
jgi:hypothetical protein